MRTVTTAVRDSVRQLVDSVVDGVPGVTGAVIASADGFVVAARIPAGLSLDAAALAAMSAATLGLANRLVAAAGSTSVRTVVQRSDDAQVFVFGAGTSAALTVLADARADATLIERIGIEIADGLARAYVTA